MRPGPVREPPGPRFSMDFGSIFRHSLNRSCIDSTRQKRGGGSRRFAILWILFLFKIMLFEADIDVSLIWELIWVQLSFECFQESTRKPISKNETKVNRCLDRFLFRFGSQVAGFSGGSRSNRVWSGSWCSIPFE